MAAGWQGRHGRRRHALRQHPQQPDRGHRDPPALARAALRLREDMAGAGKWRGGPGSVREFTFLPSQG
jgi:hypothetical protein